MPYLPVVLFVPNADLVGLSLTIPAAMVADFVSGAGVPSMHALLGAALMLGGFGAFNAAVRTEELAKELPLSDKNTPPGSSAGGHVKAGRTGGVALKAGVELPKRKADARLSD